MSVLDGEFILKGLEGIYRGEPSALHPGAGGMVNHYTPFRVAHLLNVGWLADEGY